MVYRKGVKYIFLSSIYTYTFSRLNVHNVLRRDTTTSVTFPYAYVSDDVTSTKNKNELTGALFTDIHTIPVPTVT